MTQTKRIIILAFSVIQRDPRVYRQILFLKEHYQLKTIGFGEFSLDGVVHHQLEPPRSSPISEKILRMVRLKARRFEQHYWSSPVVQSAFDAIRRMLPCDMIIANDVETLPLVIAAAKRQGIKILLDAHEYTPREFDESWKFRFIWQAYWDYICRTYLPQVDTMFTVCPGIADEYTKMYGGPCGVLTNAPFYEALSPSKIENDHIRMVHHGGLLPSRKLENMILLMDHLDHRFYLDFMLMPGNRRYEQRYLQRLQELSRDRPRIAFREPVPMFEIAKTLQHYDMGLYLMKPQSFNNRMALPNKLFEFIQGRLALAIWPSPEMARVVRKYDCGVIVDHFTIEAMAAKLNALSAADIHYYKAQSHKAASILCAETNRQLMLDAVGQLIGK